ncbi:MAG: hypothetical protein DMD96_13680 [Candidatus Rokuibacteriota bacterium]|nr:MAG: hypothetical protein DMD96_13680 [Candidatus Rokubacteria bacterium]
MSYILDALTKAAQQRDRHVPVVQRLLTPAPRLGPSWTRSPGRLLAALGLGAALPTVFLVWWLRPDPVVTPPDPIPLAAPTTVEPPRPLRLEPPPKPAVRTEKTVPATRDAIADSAPPAANPKAQPSPPPAPAPRSRAAAPPTQSAPLPTADPPVASVAPPPVQERAGLRLEALIYSEVPGQRMVFINGRRYVEGDVIDGRLKVEEIQEEGVALSEQGRRFTLRVAR